MSTRIQSVPAIDRAMDLLSALERAGTEIPIKELLSAVEIPRATVYRTLNSLASHGLVRQNARNDYSLGYRLVSLAAAVPGGARVKEIAILLNGEMKRLSAVTGETVKLSVRSGLNALSIASTTGSSDAALAGTIGRNYPLHSGASGRVLLAHAPDRVLEKVLANGLKSYTNKTIDDIGSLRASIEEVRANGYACDAGEYTVGIAGVAVPIFHKGEVVAAVSIPHLNPGTSDVRSDLLEHILAASKQMNELVRQQGTFDEQ